MKLISYYHINKSGYGILTQHGVIDLTKRIGHDYPDIKALLGAKYGLTMAHQFINEIPDINQRDITYLPVIPNPNKILCVGMNYANKRAEFNELNSAPTLFVRFADSQTGHETNIVKPRLSNELDYEGELAVIIGKAGFRIPKMHALDYVAGYSCYMDGSIRDWQHAWFTAGKNWPSTGAFGPCLVTSDEISEPNNLLIKTYLNGHEVQNDTTRNLIHSVADIIVYISTFTKLSAGDVILTGSPGGVGKKRTPPVFMQAGDRIEVEISQIGRLCNYVVDEVVDDVVTEKTVADSLVSYRLIEKPIAEQKNDAAKSKIHA